MSSGAEFNESEDHFAFRFRPVNTVMLTGLLFSGLIMARDASKARSGELLTGLSRGVLDRLAQMSLEEIEAMARDIGISVISLRLNEAEMERLLALQGLQKAAYTMAIAAGVKSQNQSRAFTEA